MYYYYQKPEIDLRPLDPLVEKEALKELNPFVEHGHEVPKDKLLRRIAGKIDNTHLQLLKALQFYLVGKDEKNNLYLL